MNLLPDDLLLSEQLSTLQYYANSRVEKIEILAREHYVGSSTFPAEIVTCKLNDGKIISLFCKYLFGTEFEDFGHRGGVKYESIIYNEVLKAIPLSIPKYYGYCIFPASTDGVLILENLQDSVRLFETLEPEVSLKDAACWIAKFHSQWEGRSFDCLKVYDESFYRLWGDEVRRLSHKIEKEHPWIIHLCTFFIDNLDLLISGPQTIIHGEYYPKNILIKNKIVYPIDWESAAMATGEIDLASLIEGWDEPEARGAIEAYKETRWGEIKKVPDKFERTLLLCQIYFYFRWFTEMTESWMMDEGNLTFLNQLAQKARGI